MKKKYFFFDIDGTLVYKDKEGNDCVLPSTLLALEKLKENGHFVAIATSRPYILTKEQAAQLKIENYTSDGGDGYCINGQLIEILPLHYHDCLTLAHEAMQHDISISTSIDTTNNRYSIDSSFIDLNSFLATAFNFVTKPDFNIDAANAIYKMCIGATKQQEEMLPTLAKVPHYRISSHCILVESLHKYRGIEHIMNHIKAPIEDVVVFGDGLNDLSMFEAAPMSIAMGNAVSILKEKATFVTKDILDDGIEYACRYYGWIE